MNKEIKEEIQKPKRKIKKSILFDGKKFKELVRKGMSKRQAKRNSQLRFKPNFKAFNKKHKN